MKDKDFASMVCRRREEGFEIHAIEVEGDKVDAAFYKDTSRETLEELADAYIYLSFEYAKLNSLGLRMELRRIDSMRKVVKRLGSDMFEYRERIAEVAPSLLENQLNDILAMVSPEIRRDFEERVSEVSLS